MNILSSSKKIGYKFLTLINNILCVICICMLLVAYNIVEILYLPFQILAYIRIVKKIIYPLEEFRDRLLGNLLLKMFFIYNLCNNK